MQVVTCHEARHVRDTEGEQVMMVTSIFTALVSRTLVQNRTTVVDTLVQAMFPQSVGQIHPVHVSGQCPPVTNQLMLPGGAGQDRSAIVTKQKSKQFID